MDREEVLNGSFDKFLDIELELGISDKKTINRIKWYFETYFKVAQSKGLPTVDEAGVIALKISPKLSAKEETFFVAGFQECIKYLQSL